MIQQAVHRMPLGLVVCLRHHYHEVCSVQGGRQQNDASEAHPYDSAHDLKSRFLNVRFYCCLNQEE